MPVRDFLKLVYKAVMIFVTVVAAGSTVIVFMKATPGNGLMLVGLILAVLTLIAGASIFTLDRRDQQVSEFPALGLEAGGKPAISFSMADPEVHHVDKSMLDEARRMAADGVPIDDICRRIDPQFDAHMAIQQEAFRRLVLAMIKES